MGIRLPHFCCLFLAAAALPAHADVAAKLDAKITGPTVTDFPLLLELTVTNTGSQPFQYWCGGPADYPQGSHFTAILMDSHGTSRKLRLSNGQNEEGSGFGRPIEKAGTFPVSLPPLPLGDFTLTIESPEERYGEIVSWPAMKAAPLKFTVTTDAPALIKARDALWERYEKDPFAKYVLYAYDLDTAPNGRVDALLDPDPKVAFNKIGGLMGLRWLSPRDAAILLQAAQLHMKDNPPDYNLLTTLSQIAVNIGTDATLPVTLAIARSRNDASSSAVADLRALPAIEGHRKHAARICQGSQECNFRPCGRWPPTTGRKSSPSWPRP